MQIFLTQRFFDAGLAFYLARLGIINGIGYVIVVAVLRRFVPFSMIAKNTESGAQQ